MNTGIIMTLAITNSMSDESSKATVFTILLFLTFPAFYIIRHIRQHPIINMRKLSDRLDRAEMLKERMKLADTLLTDINLTQMERKNVRVKGFTLKWSDTLNDKEREMHFYVDGKSETTRQLKQLAKIIRKESHKELLHEVFQMPKRHGKDEDTNYIHIHNADLLDK